MKLIDEFQKQFGKSKSPKQIVIDLWKGKGSIKYHLPQYNGRESNDFLANMSTINYTTLKDAIVKNLGSDDFTGEFLCRDECETDERALDRAREFCSDLGLGEMRILQETDFSALFWSGVAELEGDSDAALMSPWEQMESDIYRECHDLIVSAIDSAAPTLESFTLRFTEVLNATINEAAEKDQEDWLYLSSIHAGRDALIFSGESKDRTHEGQKFLKLLARVLLKIEHDLTLCKLASAKTFQTKLIETEMWDVSASALRTFAEQFQNVPLLDYLEKEIK